jgi:hypothetical protein
MQYFLYKSDFHSSFICMMKHVTLPDKNFDVGGLGGHTEGSRN